MDRFDKNNLITELEQQISKICLDAIYEIGMSLSRRDDLFK